MICSLPLSLETQIVSTVDMDHTVLLEDTFRFIHRAGFYDFVMPDKSNTFQKAIKYVSMLLYVAVCVCYSCLSIYTLIADTYERDFNSFLEQINFFIPSVMVSIKFCFLVYNVKNVHALIKIIHYDHLLCSQIDSVSSLELYKKYTSRVNMLSSIWNMCVRLNVCAWVLKPIILLVYDRLTENTNNYYPQIFSLDYPFDINECTYPIVLTYEAFTICYIALIVIFQDSVIVLFVTMMCYHFDMLQSALRRVKFTKGTGINDRKCLYKKLIVCIKSHQELLL